MKSRVAFLFTGLLISFATVAQPDSLFSRKSYFVSLDAGGLLGKIYFSPSFSASAIAGVQLNRFNFGVGTGYDTYWGWRALPVFASAGWEFLRAKQSAAYFRSNVGYAKAWYRRADENPNAYSEAGGFFFHPSVGWKIYTGRMSVYFSAGYKFQNLIYEEAPQWWIWGHPSGKVTVDRDIERLSLQIGIGL